MKTRYSFVEEESVIFNHYECHYGWHRDGNVFLGKHVKININNTCETRTVSQKYLLSGPLRIGSTGWIYADFIHYHIT